MKMSTVKKKPLKELLPQESKPHGFRPINSIYSLPLDHMLALLRTEHKVPMIENRIMEIYRYMKTEDMDFSTAKELINHIVCKHKKSTTTEQNICTFLIVDILKNIPSQKGDITNESKNV